MPEISIIVPIYKVERYLDRCVQSILNQTFTDFELILVDDGSPDNCPQMCDEWAKKDERIRVIHKENGGLSSARNAGIKAARGNYIGFVDSDDWIIENMYRILYNLICEYKADIACGGIVKTSTIYNNYQMCQQIVHIYSQHEYAELFFKVNSQDTVHYVWNKLYKSEVAKHMIFPEGYINEDVEGFFYALVNSKKIVTTNEVVYFYWINSEGISYKWFSKKQMDLLVVWKNVWEKSKEINKWEYYAKLNYYRAFFGLLCRLMLNDKKEDNLYLNEKNYLLKNLRKNYIELFFFKWSLKKKVLLTMMCVNYELTRFLVRTFLKIRNYIK